MRIFECCIEEVEIKVLFSIHFFLRLVGACAEILLLLPPKYQYTFCCGLAKY